MKKLHLTLRIWRQANTEAQGRFDTVQADDIPQSASFLEMLDIVNQRIIDQGGDPFAFDHDCREGICGMCSLVINGIPHGPEGATTTCQLHMRHFADGDTIIVEPFRARAFPVLRDLITDREGFESIVQAGGFISARTGGAQDANAIPVPKPLADSAFDAAACIGCGACVASCKNASAMLFVSAKARHLSMLPQGAPEKDRRVLGMVRAMDAAGFGNCTNQYECEAVCPMEISAEFIAQMNLDYLGAIVRESVGKA
ncbi:MAG: succinate dehydrogenase/fumarate reductase iron-sulfur subunit [Verrucomicrobiales bacterium]